MANVVVEPEVLTADPETEGNDKVAHIVKKGDANRGYIGQEVIEALCGYRWIPSQNPDRFPVCQKCYNIMRSISNRDFN